MERQSRQDHLRTDDGRHEHLGRRGVPAEADLEEKALNLRKEAQATGSTRVQQQMEDVLRSLQ